MIKLIERTTSQVRYGDVCKTCACHRNQKGLTIEEYVELKTLVHYMLDIERVTKRWGDNVVIACDEPRLDIPVIEKIEFYHFSFTPFRNTVLEVYLQLV